MTRFGLLIALLLGSLMSFTHHVSSQESLSSASSEPLRYCDYRDVIYQLGERWSIGDCTHCVCRDDAIVECVIQSCAPAFCADPIKPEGECCFRCPTDVTVVRVQPSIQSPLRVHPNGEARLILAVDVEFKTDFHTTGVNGEAIWELAAWIAPSDRNTSWNDSSNRIRFREQILNHDQASQTYRKRDPFGFRDVVYDLTDPLLNCSEASVCVQLQHGREATARGAAFVLKGYPDDNAKVGCTSLCAGTTIHQCVDSNGIVHLHKDTWIESGCDHCTCNNGTSSCISDPCFVPTCPNSEILEGECCLSCPYHVRVRKVTPLVSDQIQTGIRQSKLFFRVRVHFHDTNHTTDAEGTDLWKLSAWLSLDRSTTSDRYDHRDQILDHDQSSLSYIKGTKELAFENLDFCLTEPSAFCGRPFFLCVGFDKNGNYKTAKNRRLELSGFPDNSSLTNCEQLSLSEDWCRTLKKTTGSPSCDSDPPVFCEIGGQVHAVNETWNMDDCTTCSCGNGTVSCRTESCKATHCESPVKHPGECCFTCKEVPDETNVCWPILISFLVLICVVATIVIIALVLRARKVKIRFGDTDGSHLNMS